MRASIARIGAPNTTERTSNSSMRAGTAVVTMSPLRPSSAANDVMLESSVSTSSSSTDSRSIWSSHA